MTRSSFLRSEARRELSQAAIRGIADPAMLAEIVFGASWHERPRLLTIINSTSPLQFSADAAQVLVRLARLGQQQGYPRRERRLNDAVKRGVCRIVGLLTART